MSDLVSTQNRRSTADCVEASRLPRFSSKRAESSRPFNRNNPLLRLLRLQAATVYLLCVLSLAPGIDFNSSLISTCPLIFWDLIGFACARDKISVIPLEIHLFIEFIFFGSYLFLVGLNTVETTEEVIFWEENTGRYMFGYPSVVGTSLCLVISSVCAVYFYIDTRAYQAHRRYKRDYQKIKPIIAFTETGSPIAVFPPSQDIMLQRLSVDSLQEVHVDRNEFEA
ncbi:hypothetical protein EV127DRAFT_493953 [Xylaria flabelliformis]|nr:hypothetical protein EV127DRAFT_493953 [Xylaria flabelliformis]